MKLKSKKPKTLLLAPLLAMFVLVASVPDVHASSVRDAMRQASQNATIERNQASQDAASQRNQASQNATSQRNQASQSAINSMSSAFEQLDSAVADYGESNVGAYKQNQASGFEAYNQNQASGFEAYNQNQPVVQQPNQNQGSNVGANKQNQGSNVGANKQNQPVVQQPKQNQASSTASSAQEAEKNNKAPTKTISASDHARIVKSMETASCSTMESYTDSHIQRYGERRMTDDGATPQQAREYQLTLQNRVKQCQQSKSAPEKNNKAPTKSISASDHAALLGNLKTASCSIVEKYSDSDVLGYAERKMTADGATPQQAREYQSTLQNRVKQCQQSKSAPGPTAAFCSKFNGVDVNDHVRFNNFVIRDAQYKNLPTNQARSFAAADIQKCKSAGFLKEGSSTASNSNAAPALTQPKPQAQANRNAAPALTQPKPQAQATTPTPVQQDQAPVQKVTQTNSTQAFQAKFNYKNGQITNFQYTGEPTAAQCASVKGMTLADVDNIKAATGGNVQLNRARADQDRLLKRGFVAYCNMNMR